MSKTVLKKKMDPLRPLVELRKITQLSQGKLSRLLGVSFDLVQSVETNRARCTENLLLRIRLRVGGVWDEQKGQWVVDSCVCPYLGVEPGTPLSLELFERFQKLRRLCIPQDLMEKDNADMSELVAEFHKEIPGEFWIEFLQRWSDAMETVFSELKQKVAMATEELREQLGEKSPYEQEAIVENINAQWQAVSKKVLAEKEAEERAVAGRGQRGMRPQGASPSTSAKR
jgi:hypothetical protein